MALFSKWMHPGLRLKRWLFLLAGGILVLSIGLSAFMGQSLRGWRFDLVHPRVMDRLASQVQHLRFIDFVFLGSGIWAILFAIRRLTFSLLTILTPYRGEELAGVILSRARMNRGPKVVAIGGGTGLPYLLSGLKKYSGNLTAVVTVADDGGSSGRLRKELNIPPPGDLRNCLVAMADTEPLMGRLFQHRFGRGTSADGELSGHSFGNLFIAAMTEVTGDFSEAIHQSSRVLAISGRVLPVTLDAVTLQAELEDGREVHGESRISQAGGRVKQLRLDPPSVRVNPEVLDAIAKADAIVLGPGSLYTSILPNLLVPGMTAAIHRAGAIKIYVCNIMTQPGETDGFTVADHCRALNSQAGRDLVDYVIANTEQPSHALLQRYAADGQHVVQVDKARLAEDGLRLVRARVLDQTGGFIRHQPDRLARTVMRLIVL